VATAKFGQVARERGTPTTATLAHHSAAVAANVSRDGGVTGAVLVQDFNDGALTA
jgi:hypothetical protein